jgi:hypothetical protein
MNNDVVNNILMNELMKEQKLSDSQIKQLIRLIEDYRKHCNADDAALQNDIKILQKCLMNK